MELSNALTCITADNASSNSALAARVEKRLGGIFFAHKHLLGCMAHVINLAAHDGLNVFGCSDSDPDSEREVTLDKMDLNTITDQLDGADVNLKTIISRLHGLATYSRGSFQRRENFQDAIDFINSQSKSKKPIQNVLLRLDVCTRWNSTYLMLKRALRLKSVCVTYCSSRGEVSKYAPSDVEWNKLKQMMRFLSPLQDVTKILCGSTYPTLSLALPIYISLIKKIHSIRSQYDSAQLIPAANEMVKKLTKYLVQALEKPAPICAMILDPRIKLGYFERNREFFASHQISKVTPEDILKIFKLEAQTFDQSPS
jgi:hypothetical protein